MTSPDSAATELVPGALIDERFVIDLPLERRGAGVRYRGYHRLLGNEVVLFVSDPLPHAEAETLRAEAERARAMRLHRHMARLFEVGRSGDRVWVVEEPIDGVPLAEWLNDPHVVADDVLRIGGQLVDAVRFAASSGVVHGGLDEAVVLVREAPPTAIVRGYGQRLPTRSSDDDLRSISMLLRRRLADPEGAAPRVVELPLEAAARPTTLEAPSPIPPLPAAPESRRDDADPLRVEMPPLLPSAPRPPSVLPWVLLGALIAVGFVGWRQWTDGRRHAAAPPWVATSLTVAPTTSATVASTPPSTLAVTTSTLALKVPATQETPTTPSVSTTATTDTLTPDTTLPVESVPSATSEPLAWVRRSPSEGDAVVRVGESLAFSAAVNVTTPVAYRWRLDGKPAGTAPAWRFVPEVVHAGRVVNVELSVADGERTISHVWPVRVEAARVVVRQRQPAAEKVWVREGDAQTFSIDATVPPSVAPLTFVWSRNDRVVARGRRASWTLADPNIGDRSVAVVAVDAAGRRHGPTRWRVTVVRDENGAQSDGDSSDEDGSPPEPPTTRGSVEDGADGRGERVRIVAASPGAGGIVSVQQGQALRYGVEIDGGDEDGATWWLDGRRFTRGRVCRLEVDWSVGSFHHLQVEVPGHRGGKATTFWTLQVVPAR